MTERIEIVEKVIDGITFTGLRMYLYLPVTKYVKGQAESTEQVQGPFIHGDGDDDSSAVTFWGKKDLRKVLFKAIDVLDRHYGFKYEE